MENLQGVKAEELARWILKKIEEGSLRPDASVEVEVTPKQCMIGSVFGEPSIYSDGVQLFLHAGQKHLGFKDIDLVRADPRV